MEWITPISRCSTSTRMTATYKFTTLGLWGDRNTKTGTWCPADHKKKHYFICEKPREAGSGSGATLTLM